MMNAQNKRLWWAGACIATAVACGSSTSSSPGTSGGVVAQQTIGAAGGSITSSDGALTIAVPAGALAAELQLTVEEITAPAAGSVGKTYEIGPTGTQFEKPVTLSLKYATADLKGESASELELATIVGGAWAPLVGDSVDTAAQIASGTTLHLSPYTLIAHHSEGPGIKDAGSDATGETDASLVDGAITDASGGADAADAASSCKPEAIQVGSCLNHPKFCATYPGTTPGTCTTNDGGMGYVVMCCSGDGG